MNEYVSLFIQIGVYLLTIGVMYGSFKKDLEYLKSEQKALTKIPSKIATLEYRVSNLERINNIFYEEH